jgi:hypothetical protein
MESSPEGFFTLPVIIGIAAGGFCLLLSIVGGVIFATKVCFRFLRWSLFALMFLFYDRRVAVMMIMARDIMAVKW